MKIALIILVILAALISGYAYYTIAIVNPRVEAELAENPMGERARRVMLLTFPDDKMIPVNYLREGNLVYAGADGAWWRALEGGVDVTLFVQGETLKGRATVELDDREMIDDVFSRLRPTVPEWLPDWANGKLVVIEITASTDR